MNRRAVAAVALLAVLGAAGVWLYSEKKPAEPNASTKPTEPTSEKPGQIPPSAPLGQPAPTAPKPATGRFDLGPDGAPVPPLPDGAPERVKLGVALFAYEGAQGVPGAFRSQKAALELAKAAISASGGEFSKLLAKADPGSRDDVGWIRRGVLERSVERAVFLQDKGTTSKEPIDTPRGYWVVQRSQ